MSKSKSENRGQQTPAPAPSRPCPVCGQPAALALRPFCSKRCADIDLHRWLSGAYRISGDCRGDAGQAGDEDLPES
ncbi:MAG TPA: DNA gyrase inhibitor YacG [Methylocella sp.]|nr:DNA gyrase inhibitor YacG [Methylocella sp.]